MPRRASGRLVAQPGGNKSFTVKQRMWHEKMRSCGREFKSGSGAAIKLMKAKSGAQIGNAILRAVQRRRAPPVVVVPPAAAASAIGQAVRRSTRLRRRE